jgi:hypothetical protein
LTSLDICAKVVSTNPPEAAAVTFQTEILADITRRDRARDASPARLERRRAARLLEAIARCCRPTLSMRLRAAASRLAA